MVLLPCWLVCAACFATDNVSAGEALADNEKRELMLGLCVSDAGELDVEATSI
jgi:hypothetical protein